MTDAPAGLRTIAVTGATGFVGSHLLPYLSDKGYHVRALTRRPRPSDAHIEWVHGELEDPATLARLVDGADAVVHGAALIKARGRDEFFGVNEGGTRAMAAAALEAGAKRFLLISSLAAREPQLSHYAASKKASEDIVTGLGSDKMDWSVLRVPAVYGAGDRETLKLFQTLKWRLALLPAGADRVALLHVADLCRAIRASLESDAVAGQILGVDDMTPDGHALMDFYRQAAAILGVRPVFTRLPESLLVGIGALNEGLASLRGRPAMLTRGKARELSHADWRAHKPHLADITDWRPEVDTEQGLRSTFAWYRAQEWL